DDVGSLDVGVVEALPDRGRGRRLLRGGLHQGEHRKDGGLDHGLIGTRAQRGINARGAALGGPAGARYHPRPMPLPERPGLSVVLPVYNEALVLERTFAELLPFL